MRITSQGGQKKNLRTYCKKNLIKQYKKKHFVKINYFLQRQAKINKQ